MQKQDKEITQGVALIFIGINVMALGRTLKLMYMLSAPEIYYAHLIIFIIASVWAVARGWSRLVLYFFSLPLIWLILPAIGHGSNLPVSTSWVIWLLISTASIYIGGLLCID